MKASEFDNAADRLTQLVLERIPQINEKMALDATAMVKDRLINDGEKANGASLGKYSTNEVPLFFRKNGKLMAPFSSPLNNNGEKFMLDVQKENQKLRKEGQPPRGISYEQWRRANNRPTEHVTLSFSGTTMKDIGVTKQIVSGARIVTGVGAKNTKIRKDGTTTEQVVQGLSERYGNFLEPNAAETEILRVYLENQINQLINDSFNNK